MVNNKRYTNIRVILDEVTQNELLQDITLEQVVGYVIRFNGIFNIPELYTQKEVKIPIKDYRGELPCDLVSVIQVMDKKTGLAMRTISGTFFTPKSVERAFKTQGNVIFTTFKDGEVVVAYNAIPADEEGYPLILDDEKYKNTLCLYIKQDRYTKYFDTGKISQAVLQNTQQEYCWAAGQLSNSLKMPSYSEWEAISNEHNQLLPKTREFEKGFETSGLRENYKRH